MTYYNKTTRKYYRGGALHTAKGTIFNPSEATLKANGYAPYVAPVVEPTPPTNAEIEALRAAAYRDRVDPLTCQIQRMADMGAAASEIDALRAVRDATFYAIQREFPYA